MHNRLRALARTATVSVVWLAAAAAAAQSSGDDNATLLRVFLRDGTSLVSFGEPARVDDRVIFSMPTGPLPNPPLHLVNLPVATIDWERTDRYAAAARATRYLKSQAELDYTALSAQLTQALSDVAATTDQAERLAIVERARRVLAEWPQNHYNYRRDEVRNMVSMLDEAIADLRAAQGANRFSLAFEAFADPPPFTEPLLPQPTLQESIEQVLLAARTVDSSDERSSLLSSALSTLEMGKADLPSAFVANTREELETAIKVEAETDRSYLVLTRGVLAQADQRARAADVRGVERLFAQVKQRDTSLGGRRPEAVRALVAAVEAQLDAARRLRLARDRWALRAPVLAQYREAMGAPMTLFAQLRPALEAIKALSGSTPASLAFVQRVTARILEATAVIVPPEEVSAPHAILISAVQMAANAASARLEATLANDMNRAWNASSAAAGALMLGSRARADIQTLLRSPQLR